MLILAGSASSNSKSNLACWTSGAKPSSSTSITGKTSGFGLNPPFHSSVLKTPPPEGPGAVVNIPRQGPTGIFELRVVPIKERLERGKFQGTIRIFTNDAEFPELLIPVRIEVE